MRIVVATLLGCTALGTAGAVKAQVSEKLVACAARLDNAERLACYDSVVKSLGAEARAATEAREKAAKAAEAEAAAAAAAQAAAATEAAAAAATARAAADAEAKAAAAREREQAFGDAKASAQAEERVESLATRIEEVFTDARKQPLFLMENGQLWRQTDGLPLVLARSGMDVEIRRGALGGFRMTVPRAKATISVRRVR
jgi:SWI/SNF-related matrix-associated actin-dependent regulator 1 of chromatin subfamily A